MYARLLLSTVFALFIFETSVAAAPPATRRWADRTGKFSVEAEYVETKQDSVVLRKASGSTVTVPLARLSDADLEYLKTLARPDAKSSNKGDARPNLAFPDALTEPPPWNDANTPFDMAAFLKAPPSEENAAPLYLEAFCEFSSEMDLLIPEMPEQERRQWISRSRKLYKEQERLDDAWKKDPKSVSAKEVDAWLANYDAGFEKLAAAQQRPKCIFQPGRSLHSLLPHDQVARQVAWVVEWRTRRDVQRGDLERPLQDLKMLLRLSRDLQVRGGIGAQLVAIALNEQCYERVGTILSAPGINVGHCDRPLALLAEHEAKAIDAFVEANRADYISCRQALHDLQHRTGSFDPKTMKDTWGLTGDVTSPLACIKLFSDLGGLSPQKLEKMTVRLQAALLPGAWTGGKMLSDEDYAKEVAALNRYFASMLALAEKPNFLRTAKADASAAEALINETTLATWVNPAPWEGTLWHLIRRSEARLRGTQCLVALRRWQLEHAEPPPDLETLVKAAGMPRVPMDPYSDKPLRLGSVAGKAVIYSVGPDDQDDGAKVEWNLVPGEKGDFIFQLSNSPVLAR